MSSYAAMPLDWLKKYAFNRLETAQEDILAKFIELESASTPNAFKNLATDIFDYKAAMILFGLKEDSSNRFQRESEIFHHEVPDTLRSNLSDITTTFYQASQEEMCMALKLDVILVNCIAQQRRRLQTDHIEYQPYMLDSGTKFEHPAEICNGREDVVGRATYTFRLPEIGEENILTVIMQANKRGTTDLIESKLVAYMGIVYNLRKLKGKTHCVVHGISTDSSSFRFWRIGNAGGLTRTRLLKWDDGDDGTVVSYIRNMLYWAAVHPLTGPKKDPALAKQTRKSFGSSTTSAPNKKRKTSKSVEDRNRSLVGSTEADLWPPRRDGDTWRPSADTDDWKWMRDGETRRPSARMEDCVKAADKKDGRARANEDYGRLERFD